MILKNLFPFYGTNFLKFSFLLFCWTILIFSSSDIKNNLVNNANAQSCGANLNINSATASGNDGNVPSNVLDNDLGTRWSSLGDGQFITADLGSSKKICSVDIAWYNGNVRQNHFVISTSTDGSTFSNKFSGDSSGTTLESEKYMLSTVTDARYVRVTVNGNTVNNWASITELDISGLSSISSVGYNYDPSFTATGSNFYDVASTSALQISQFSVAAWFKTSSDFATDVTIVNKGGFGSETTGQNMNYGIWMNNAEKVKGGFETGTGTDFYVTSPNSYADNQWHYAVVTYDGSTVKLYIDGAQVGSKSTSGASADKTGTQPVRVGANSRTTPPTANFFIGNVDEVRVWNDDLTAQQVSDAFAGTSFNTAEQVLYLNFSVGDESYTYAPSFTATGSNFFDVASTSSLKLSQFSVAAWFKTATDFASEAFIVNKGGTGSETAGQNQNYQISMTSTEKIKGGFETSTGADFFVTSPNTYNDNHWHYAVVTYDGTTLRLYVDGAQVASKSTSGASPDSSGTKPVRIGANSRTTPPTGNFFIGNVDEVRVWNDDLTAQQVSDAFAGTSFNTAEQVLFLPFTNIGAGTDIFGIKKLYQTKSNGEEWYIDMNNPLSDSRFDPQNTITKNPDGSWKMKSSKVRMNVYTSTGYDSNDIPTLDHSKIASKGYMSSQYYSFDHQNVHFISASTELPFEIGSKQYDFIKNDLEKTSSDPKINWIVVFFHRLAYTSPSLIDPIKSIRETFHPLFQKYGVDLVMQGHSHNYQRTYPILYNATNSLNPIVTDKNTTNYYNPKGQIFTITGTGGSPFIHNFTEPAAPFTATQFSGKFGFLDINVTHNGTVLEGKFYDNMGAVDDHFTIEKSMDKR